MHYQRPCCYCRHKSYKILLFICTHLFQHLMEQDSSSHLVVAIPGDTILITDIESENNDDSRFSLVCVISMLTLTVVKV